MVSHAGPLKFVAPMECTQVAELPDDRAKWIYEVKLDGYRCCAIARGKGKSAIYSRYGNSWTDRFDKVRRALAAIETPMILDGEIVAIDRGGLPSFQQLQNLREPIVFYAFDLLHLDGRDLRREPIETRRELLAQIPLQEPLRLSATLDAPLPTLVARMKSLGLEGLVAKRLGTRYESGKRSKLWLKHRFNQVEELVVGGYIPEGDTFSRLFVGTEELRFVKKLKNGFTPFTKQEVMRAIRGSKVKRCPFVNPMDIDPEDRAEAVWVSPRRRVEVEFVEWTAGGKLRHASFRRLVDQTLNDEG